MPTSQHEDDVEGHSDGHQSTSADTCMHAPTLDRALVGRAPIHNVESSVIPHMVRSLSAASDLQDQGDP